MTGALAKAGVLRAALEDIVEVDHVVSPAYCDVLAVCKSGNMRDLTQEK